MLRHDDGTNLFIAEAYANDFRAMAACVQPFGMEVARLHLCKPMVMSQIKNCLWLQGAMLQVSKGSMACGERLFTQHCSTFSFFLRFLQHAPLREQ